MTTRSVYIITDRAKKILAATLDHAGKKGAVAVLVPGPGQRLFHLPNVPKEIVQLKDATKFHAAITKYFKSTEMTAVEIKARQRAELLTTLRNQLAKAS
jgi:hypothetical protein